MKYNMDDIVNEKFIDIEEKIFEKNKKRAIRRKNNVKKALRKQRIKSNMSEKQLYDSLHPYSKNYILLGFGTTNHRMCKNWNISDTKKINSCESQLSVWEQC